MQLKSISLVLAVLLLAGCASMGPRVPTHEDPFAMPIDEFMQEHAILRANLLEGEPRELEEDEWTKFDEISGELVDLVGDATEIEQIDMQDRHQLYELRLAMVNLVVGDVEPEMVCFRQHTTGTRLRGQRRCYTLQDLENRRFDAQALMRYIGSMPQGMDHSGGF
jgi:hypothetical protein